MESSHCRGFSCCGAWALGAQASVVVARGLSSCGLWALELRLSSVAHGLSCSAACGIFPGPGIEPMSLALAGGFLTTVPPGKPPQFVLKTEHFHYVSVETRMWKYGQERFFRLTYVNPNIKAMK